MKYKFIYHILMVISLFSCIDKYTRNRLAIFKDIDAEQYESNVEQLSMSPDKPRVISVSNPFGRGDFSFSSLFDTITYIKLSNEPGALIGVIDKIVFNDSSVYVLDRYKTRSIKRFSMKGEFLSVIGKRGDGPEEYIEPTDFAIYENEIIVYDQFKSDLKYYNPNGELKYRKKVPFLFLKFACFSNNHYVFQSVDADNDHLQSIVNYSIFESDSTFVLNRRGFYRPKNLYVSLIDNNFYHAKNKIYYHPSYRDTIYSIGDDNIIRAEYAFQFQRRKLLPLKYQLQKNSKERFELMDTDEYIFFDGTFVPTKDCLYFSYVIKHLVYQGFYSNKTNNIIVISSIINDMNYFFPFSNILTALEDNVLVGYSQTDGIEDLFKQRPREEWVKIFGNKLIELVEDIKNEDNPVIVLYKLKDF